MSRSFLRMRQPAITRINPHAGNRNYLIPNIFGRAGGGEDSSLQNGLVSQCDVDTNGRSDGAPYDNKLDNVAVLQNAPQVVAGEGGYSGMQFILANQQSVELPPPAIDYTGPFTLACRSRTQAALVDNATLSLARDSGGAQGPLLATKITRDAQGDPEAFYQQDNGQFTIVQGVSAESLADGVEHVIIVRSLGGGTGRVQMIVDQELTGDVTGAYTSTTTIDNMVWGAFKVNGAFGFWGTNVMQWSAIWDRLLNNEEVVACSAQPNPFGRSA